MNDKVIDDISDVRDESDRDGMRIVIELKRGAEPQIVLNQLYKHTQMQESFSMIFLAVVNGQPKEMGLVQAHPHFIDHRIDVVRRRTAYLLQKAREREHILRRLPDRARPPRQRDHASSAAATTAPKPARTWSRTSPARTINVIEGTTRQSGIAEGRSGRRDARSTLRQIDAILELQLYRLTQLSIDEILKELAEVRGQDRRVRIDPGQREEAAQRHRQGAGRDQEEIRRRAPHQIIQDETAELQLEDLIADEQVAVTVSHSGYLKRTPISTYRQQRRGGTGRKGMRTREEDFVAQLIVDSTHAYLLCFTNTGRVYWLKVYEIPDVERRGQGQGHRQPGRTAAGRKRARHSCRCAIWKRRGKYIFFATRNGTVKKTPLKDFSNVMSRGIIAIGIDKDDELVAAQLTDGNQIIFLATHEGMAIRFDEDDVRSMGRPAYGVRGMDLDKGDYIVGMAVTPKERKKGEERRRPIDPTSSSPSPRRATASAPTWTSTACNARRQGRDQREDHARNGKVVAIMLVNEDSRR